jgi:phosphate transport system substrate-binding protein
MKSFSVALIAVFLSIMPLSVVGAQEAKGFDGTIRLSGSTTVLPVAAAGSRQFMEKYRTWNQVDPSLPNVPIKIFVNGGGSGVGIKSAMDGTANIGMSSRDLKETEKAQLGPHQEFLISKDCLAFAVNKKNPLAKLDNLTAADLARIYSGEAKTFNDINPTLPAKPILVQMRDAAGGSTEIVKHDILKEKNFTPNAVQVPSQGANLKKLEENASAIGYISSVLAMQSPQLKVFKFEGVEPTNDNVINGHYQLTRPLLLIVKGTPDAASRKFIDFMLNEGQKIIVEHGYVPVKKVL